MPVVPVPFVKGLVTSNQDGDWLDSLPVNMLAVPKPVLDAQGYMRSWPGIEKTADVPGQPRGVVLNDVDNITYRVQGTSLINADTGETLVDVGGSGHASLPFSRNSQAIVSNGTLNYWRDGELTQIRNWEEGERETDTEETFINYTINYNGATTRVDVFPWSPAEQYQITATVFVRDTESKQWLFASSNDDDEESGLFIEDGMFWIQADSDTDAVSFQEVEEGLNELDYAGMVTIAGGVAVFGAIRNDEDDEEDAENAYRGFFDGQIYNIRLNDFDPPEEDGEPVPNNRSYTATILDDEVPEETILIDERSDGEELAREVLVEVTGGTPSTPAESDDIVEMNELTIGNTYAVTCEVVSSGTNQSGFSDRNGIGTEARVSGSGDIEHVFRATERNQAIVVFTQNGQATFRNVVVQDVTHGIITAGIWQRREQEEDPDSVLPETDFDLSNIIDATRNRSRYAWIQANSNTFGVTDLENEQRPDYIAPFYSAEAEPGINIAIDSWRDYIVIFTRDTVEYFALTGSVELIYQPVQSLNVRAGIIGLTCKTHYLDHFAILGGPRPEPPSLFIISQGQYQEIATRRIQKILRQYTELQLASAFLETVKFDAHDILLVHLPNEVLAYDHNVVGQIESASWVILQTGTCGTTPYRGTYHMWNGRDWSAADKRQPILSRFNFESGAHIGQAVEYRLDSQMLQARNVKLFDLDVDTVPGHSNRAYRLSISITYDGITYGQQEWITFDTPQEYTERVLLRILGYCRYNIGFRLRWIADTPTAISNLRVRVER